VCRGGDGGHEACHTKEGHLPTGEVLCTPMQRMCKTERAYLTPHKASLQLGDVGVSVSQCGQVGPLILQLVVEQFQQLPGQVIVPGGGRGIQGKSKYPLAPGTSEQHSPQVVLSTSCSHSLVHGGEDYTLPEHICQR
jgi:hypothetical protein